MFWALIGIILGIFVGLALNFPIPLELTKYSAVVIMGILDALFGAIRAEVTKDQFNAIIFITGLLFNVILSIAITLLGDKLGLELYLAATFVFTLRIFSNVGITRRAVLQNILQSDKKKETHEES
ncbi:small basic family protein [Patescibacteria group bacterium]|nr:small basic family protein [Patescibacteria group bacterium]MBU1703166.1 small basic family protein [Patescibacteria group bacterium]MBU1954317.1 small basic family protein [Patescibacteria group bacterium]